MSLDEALQKRLTDTIASSRMVLFMKGNRAQPQCGFSARVIEILDDLGAEYHTVDVLSSPELREGIKVFSNWPTIPQLYIEGQFVGGADIVQSLHGSGELHQLLGVSREEVSAPILHVTADAAAELGKALAEAGPGEGVRLQVSPRFQVQLTLDEERPGDYVVEASGVRFLMDRGSAKRGSGITLGFEQKGMNKGFTIDNPNKPQGVRALTPLELKAKLDAGSPIHLFDVRTERERQTASIAAALPLDGAAEQAIMALPKDSMLVFHCHHGMRSQQAAEEFASRGFTNVWNLTGGIDDWSRMVDPTVVRY